VNRSGRPPEIPPVPLDVGVVVRARAVVGESPVWDAARRCLWFVDIRGRAIHRCDAAGADRRSWALPDLVTSLAPRAAGGLVLTLRKAFALFDPETGRLDRLADPEPERPGNRFNDGKCDRQGRLWAGTMGEQDWQAETGALYRLDAGHRITRMHDRVVCSNGTGWSPDGRTMYHTESFRYGIFAFDFDPDTGGIANRRPFVRLDPAAGGFPDGLTVDADGFVWSAQPGYGRLLRYDPTGRIERILALPVSRPTSCMFGGAGLRTLYITTATETLTAAEQAEEPLAGSLLACAPGMAGLPETPFAG
jgi:sugar lactone lactonase YvrE